MKIISNFTDYYDKMLGFGIDDKVVFNRINQTTIKPTENIFAADALCNHSDKSANILLANEKVKIKGEGDSKIRRFIYNEIHSFWNNGRFQNDGEFNLEKVHAVINAQVFTSYILTQKKSYQDIIVKKNISDDDAIDFVLNNPIHSKYSRLKGLKTEADVRDAILNDKSRYYYKHGNQDLKNGAEVLLKIHKDMEVPIFFIYESKHGIRERYSVVKNLPLHYFGLTNIFENNVELLYQEIAYCIGNVIQNKNEPPLKIDDKVKLEQAGFDKITSFRKM